MANYQESNVTGSKYRRAHQVSIENTLNSVPLIRFFEQDVINLGDDYIIKDVSFITESFSDPDKVFEIYNPVTGETVGTSATYQDVYVMLHSLYLNLALERDAASVPPISGG